MKILLSAYACEPDKGSEPGVGWNWAMALQRRGYEVHVITRRNNREVVERAYDSAAKRPEFHYFDLPNWGRFWKHWPGGIYVYYLLWQSCVYCLAKRLHSRERFDLVHHITFVSFRQPSFMGGLGIPFVFGPVGGGESMPKQFQTNLPFAGRIAERIRDAGNSLVALDPFMRHTYSRADVIVCTTDETRNAIPRPYRHKCIVQRAIGIEESKIAASADPGDVARAQQSRPRFLFIGRLLYWKGLHLALRALAQVRHQVPDICLRVVGEGDNGDWLKSVAEHSGVTDLVEWITPRPQNEIWQEYRRSIGFVFPSFHDSGGMVVLEALAAGLPVICLDLGGPGAIVDSTCGFSLRARETSEDAVVTELASAMVRLATDTGLRGRLREGAVRKARATTWDGAADAVYSNAKVVDYLAGTSLRKPLAINQM